MTDRELLELAAKAAGLLFVEHDGSERSGLLMVNWAIWNPRDDDGDALRLAAHLRLRVLPGKYMGDGCSVEPQNRPGIPGCVSFRDSKDMAEQMRHAIVHVAAEVGKALP